MRACRERRVLHEGAHEPSPSDGSAHHRRRTGVANRRARGVPGAPDTPEGAGHARAASSLVHIGQRVAASGIGIAQRGQSFVVAAGSLMSMRAMRNTTKATITNVITVLRKIP